MNNSPKIGDTLYDVETFDVLLVTELVSNGNYYHALSCKHQREFFHVTESPYHEQLK